MPKTDPDTTLAAAIVTEVGHLRTLENDLNAKGHQELANVARLARLEFQNQAVTGFLNRVAVDSRSIMGAI